MAVLAYDRDISAVCLTAIRVPLYMVADAFTRFYRFTAVGAFATLFSKLLILLRGS